MALADFPVHFATRFPGLIGRRILVALSGGPDSVALLHLLNDPELELQLEAVHVHHGTRGDEADRDARFCEEVCRELKTPFHLRKISIAGSLPAGREGTWRQHRYRALLELRAARCADAVATGHHRDDVAEGVLVQMLRGGGPRALAGIAAQTPSDVIRPLLPWTRDELAGWLQDRGIRWREDSSNRDQNLLRNRVRHEILPFLEAASPSLRQHLVYLAETLSSTEAHLAHELADRAVWIEPWDPDGGVPTATIGELPPPLRTRWLHAQARAIGLERVTRRQLALFDEMIATGHPRAVTLEGRWRLRLARGQLWLEPPREPPAYAFSLAPGETIDLTVPGWKARFRDDQEPEGIIRWSFRPRPGVALVVRSSRDGDCVSIEGAPVRASRLLAQAMPRHLRRSWPVFCEDDRIYWIPGVWQDPTASRSEGPAVEVIRCEQSAGGVRR
jgi:tRNA(Ile)-lysidine synthase